MKNILIVTGIFPPDIGGPATYAQLLANSLSERGFNITLITYSESHKVPGDNLYNFKLIRIWKKNFWLFRHISFVFHILINARKKDIIYSLSTINGGIPSLISARLFKKKFYMRIAGDYAWQAAVGAKKSSLLIDDFQDSKKSGWIKFLFYLQAGLCKRANKIVVPSKYLGDIVRGWGVPIGKINVIYNGIDFEPEVISKEEARKKIGVLGHVVLSVGRLVPWKGFRMLIKIMPQLSGINQAFRLVIVGDGPDRRILEAMVKNLGLERKVFLVGKKNKADLATYLTAADIFVLNTGYEGFSHQILEVMASGVPVITTAVGGNKEVMKQGENGFLVKYNDEFNLVEAIRSAWESPELREEFIANGKKTAERFSSVKMLNETIKLLSE